MPMRWLMLLGLVAALACRERSGAGGASGEPKGASGPPAGTQLCGGSGEGCCDAPLPECSIGLQCAAGSRTCEPSTADAGSARLCRSADDCEAGERCCPLGSIGACAPATDAECPLPDLRLIAPVRLEPAWYVQDNVDDCTPEGGCQCGVERGCVRAAGTRRVLVFEPTLLNVGAADLILGGPAAKRVPARDACTQSPLADIVLRYELVDARGGVVVTGSGQMLCTSAPRIASSERHFDCDFRGLEPTAESPTVADCPPDITDVAPGDYSLVVTVNPDRALVEQNYLDDSITLPLTIPPLADPRQACPNPEVALYGDYYSYERECGWAEANVQRCEPGATVELSCPDCRGEARLRICDGEQPCNAVTRLAGTVNETTYIDATGFNLCPSVVFVCPPSGTVSSWVASATPPFEPSQASCNPRVPSAPASTPEATPAPAAARDAGADGG